MGSPNSRAGALWRYREECVWALQLQAVGHYFSTVTGFPSMSLGGELCIFYLDWPSHDPIRLDSKPPRDTDGLYIPKAWDCHTRYPLLVQLDQAADRASIPSEIERRRDDVWFVRPDGSNVETVVEDVRRSILEWGIPLLLKPYNARSEQIKRRGLGRVANDSPGG
jgi:hypothetical protein